MRTKKLQLLAMFFLAATVVFANGKQDTVDQTGKTTPAATSTPGATTTKAEPVSIRVVWWGDAKRHELYNKICDAFTAANPTITLVREPISWADYWDKLSVQTAGGTAPDFMGMHPQYANDYVARKSLEPLDGYVKDGTLNLSQFSKSAIDSGVFAGVNFMVPMGITSQAFLVNKTFLTDVKVAMPTFDWTYADLKTAAAAARVALDSAGKKDTWLINDNTTNYTLFRYWVRSAGHDLYKPDGTLGFTEEDLTTWFTYWKSLRDAKLVPDAATTIEYKTATLEMNTFAKGMTGIINIPVNQYGLYKAALPNAELVALRNPSKAAGKIGEFLEGAHFAVSASSPANKKVAAVKLLNFWVNNEKSYDLFKLDQGVPANAKMATYITPTLNDNQKIILDFVSKVSKLTMIPAVYAPAGATEVDSLFRVNVGEKVLFGTLTPEAAAKQIMTEGAAILLKNKK
ncbi:MAG: extracellular solute-binding protein [Treponemataceae bacterium]